MTFLVVRQVQKVLIKDYVTIIQVSTMKKKRFQSRLWKSQYSKTAHSENYSTSYFSCPVMLVVFCKKSCHLQQRRISMMTSNNWLAETDGQWETTSWLSTGTPRTMRDPRMQEDQRSYLHRSQLYSFHLGRRYHYLKYLSTMYRTYHYLVVARNARQVRDILSLRWRTILSVFRSSMVRA